MPHLVAAPDKFRATATAAEVTAAAAGAARRAGWTADEVPMSDGGEGLLDALGGTRHVTTVTGPLGAPVQAEWRMIDRAARSGATAVIEMSRAAGRALVPQPGGDDPVRATTTGVGQLLLAARDAGAARIVIGCGGSATTDGGAGAYDAVGSPAALAGVELIVACDVTTPFLDAAVVFGTQKGATPGQIDARSPADSPRSPLDTNATPASTSPPSPGPVPRGVSPAGSSRSAHGSSRVSNSWPASSAWPAASSGPTSS